MWSSGCSKRQWTTPTPHNDSGDLCRHRNGPSDQRWGISDGEVHCLLDGMSVKRMEEEKRKQEKEMERMRKREEKKKRKEEKAKLMRKAEREQARRYDKAEMAIFLLEQKSGEPSEQYGRRTIELWNDLNKEKEDWVVKHFFDGIHDDRLRGAISEVHHDTPITSLHQAVDGFIYLEQLAIDENDKARDSSKQSDENLQTDGPRSNVATESDYKRKSWDAADSIDFDRYQNTTSRNEIEKWREKEPSAGIQEEDSLSGCWAREDEDGGMVDSEPEERAKELQGELQTGEVRGADKPLTPVQVKTSTSTSKYPIASDKLEVTTALPMCDEEWNPINQIRVCLPSCLRPALDCQPDILAPEQQMLARLQPPIELGCTEVVKSANRTIEIEVPVLGDASKDTMGATERKERQEPTSRKENDDVMETVSAEEGDQHSGMQGISAEWEDEMSRPWDPGGVILWIDCEGLRWERDNNSGTTTHVHDRLLHIAARVSTAVSQDPVKAKLRIEVPCCSESSNKIGNWKAGLVREIELGTRWEFKCGGTGPKGELLESRVWDPGGSSQGRIFRKIAKSLARNSART